MQDIIGNSWVQTLFSVVVGAILGFLGSLYFARQSASDLDDKTRTLREELEAARKLIIVQLRALEGASIIDPLRWEEVRPGEGKIPIGISHLLYTRREGAIDMKYIISQNDIAPGLPRVGRCVCVPDQNPPSEIKL